MVSHHSCFAGCEAEDGLKYHIFPKNPALRALWLARIPPQYEYAKCGKKLKKKILPKEPKLCSRHFLPEDYKTKSSDSNNRRKKQAAQENLIRTHLLEEAIPTVWPDSEESQKPLHIMERSSYLSLPSVREEKEAIIQSEKDSISSLSDLKSLPFESLAPVTLIAESNTVSILKINTDVSPPVIDFSIKIRESLEYEIFFRNKGINVSDVLVSEKSPKKITSYSFLKKLLDALAEKRQSPEEEIDVDKIAQEIEDLPFNKKQQEFLSEQVRLLSKTPHQRRYSPDLLAMACMWLSVSPALYKQIQSEGVIQLPSERYARQLTGAITADLTLSESTLAYLKARMSKLLPKDHAINLILDEVFSFKTVQYSAGKFFGNENGSITKTLLCIMIKSIAGGYRDVIAMSPIDEISAEKIHAIWSDAVKKLTIDLGFNVCATTADNHKSNMKHFKKILCPGELESYIPNPFDSSKKIFLLFDSTHILKCISNNFRNKECFVCPKYKQTMERFEDSHPEANFYPNFAHVKELQNIEIGKPVKIAHKISDKVINPLALEKTNVSLADALFDESTINGLLFYGRNGFPAFIQTAKFLRIIRNWWDTFNVKSKCKGKHKRNKFMKAVDKENVNEISAYLNEFSDWVKEWQDEYPDFGLTSPTFKALLQTVKATKDLCSYLLENVEGVEYVLLGFLQQDYLEGRFGWYRQLSGGNYYCSVLQFLQAEKTIRLRNLVNCGFNMKEIKEIFAQSTAAVNKAIKGEASLFAELLSDFTFFQPSRDVEITYYVAGYMTKNLVKASKCESCHSIFSDGLEPLTITLEMESVSTGEVYMGKAFVDSISRGGLTKPSQLLYITCMHASLLWGFIRREKKILDAFLLSLNPRDLFVEVFIQQLQDDFNTTNILKVECEKGHKFQSSVRTIAFSMFNLFAKNYAQEQNDELHAQRKRSSVEKAAKKRDPYKMKEKKAKS